MQRAKAPASVCCSRPCRSPSRRAARLLPPNRSRRSMQLGVPASELVLLVVALLAAGLLAGFLAGLLGIGGGGVLVPVLYEVYHVLDVDPAIRMHMALGTTLAIILPTSLKSFAGHRAR